MPPLPLSVCMLFNITANCEDYTTSMTEWECRVDRMTLTGENLSVLWKTYHSATLSTINPRGTGLGLNQALHSEKPVTSWAMAWPSPPYICMVWCFFCAGTLNETFKTRCQRKLPGIFQMLCMHTLLTHHTCTCPYPGQPYLAAAPLVVAVLQVTSSKFHLDWIYKFGFGPYGKLCQCPCMVSYTDYVWFNFHFFRCAMTCRLLCP